MSRKQRVTVLSTVEAEFIALSEATREAMWMRNFSQEIEMNHITAGNPIIIHLDNQGTKKLAENRAASERTKHIDLKVFFVQDIIENNIIELKYVPSQENLADSLTKTINPSRIIEHCSQLGVKDQGGC